MWLNYKKIGFTALAALSVGGFALSGTPAHAQQGGEDPLAAFKKNAGSSPSNQSNNSGQTQLPTPGGFQQPGGAEGMSLEQLDAEARMSLEEQQKELERKTREQAFESSLKGLMPMSPEEIALLLEEFRVSREAAEQRVGGIPEPEVIVKDVPLDPGAKPPVIRVSPGYVTSVNIMDITGKPWPVESLSWGGEFEIISPGQGGHIVRISPLKAHEVGNISIQLVGLDTPVTFAIHSQLERVQYRFDARIPEYGPNADMPIIDHGVTIKAGANPAVGTVLQGVMPAQARRLDIEGTDGRTTAYRHGGQTLVRTPLTLLSPGWSESAKSADGMTVYVINNSPVLLLSDKGKMVRATIKESEVQ